MATMGWTYPAHEGQPTTKKTEHQIVIERLAEVAAEITQGTGDLELLKRERMDLIRRFHEIKDFKLPN